MSHRKGLTIDGYVYSGQIHHERMAAKHSTLQVKITVTSSAEETDTLKM